MNNTRALFLQAMDVWMFRDGKPFDAGMAHRAESLFPPFPTVIQGALRSHELVLAGVNLKDQDAIKKHVGTATDTNGFKVNGVFLAKMENKTITVYLPVPANAAPGKDGWQCLKPKSIPDIITGSPLPELIVSGLDAVKHHGFGEWLTLAEWQKFWSGEPVKGITSSELFAKESRFGIEVTHERRTVKEGQLYEAEFIRPCKDAGLLVETDGFTNPGWNKGLLRIGGEGHAASYETVTGQTWPKEPKPLPKRFAACLVMPAFFDSGWQPKDGNWSKYFDGKVNLVSAAFGRAQTIGGFDWAKSQKNPKDPSAHKPAKRYVPAGAVYFFENQGATALKQPLTDEGENFGFGRVLIQEI